ncbi:YjbE family putative metal transport protein [Ornithinibacillus sp. L9]|uniref:YjbE family putative metal transport protein n=1 Tax=Ornithinibacillus caprae TaxID=2678566 RepID=A0A6N8FFG2_9BACI|nr:TerC family protein [Ornithinibacillus caprae]MUK88253.1 YjbE family putative metal transport protein [Ornithinibacillus caprae]
MEFIEPLLKILLINLVLSGDNAVVIAMASRNLPDRLKKKAIVWGTLGAVAFRIIFTVLVIYLLKLPFIHLIGGLLLLIVAYKLLVDNEEEANIKVGNTLQDAVIIIIFADVLMSLDNVLAIVAVSSNNFLLILIVGIVLTIPIILFASQLIIKIMDKYSFIVYLGAGLLTWTAGEMILKEQFVQQYISSVPFLESLFLIGMVIFIMIMGGYNRARN